MRAFIVFATVLVAALALPSSELLGSQWLAFKQTHGKLYDSHHEELKRHSIFIDNLRKIEEHNSRFEEGSESYKMGMNHFGDLTEEEFVEFVNKYKMPESTAVHELYEAPEDLELPASVDWRTSKKVTSVKNQKSCGSCWSFSAAGSLEGQNAIKNNKLVSLSEQQLVDCAGASYGNYGCNGGLMDNAFDYIIKHGITTEAKYPYKAVKGTCKYNPSSSVLKVKSYVDIPQGSESALQSAVADKGPVSIAIDATSNMQFYHSGYFYDKSCSSTSLNHGVLAVGYGGKGSQAYWIVKNSWGPAWGEKGYVKMARNRDNRCGVATLASYPVL